MEYDDKHEKVIEYVQSIQDTYLSQKAEANSTIKQIQSQIEIEEETLSKIEENKNFLNERKKVFTAISEAPGVEKKTAEKIGEQIALKEKEYGDYKELFEAGVISKADLLSMESELLQLRKESEIQQLRSTYESNDKSLQLAEINNQIIAIEKDYNNQKNVISQSTARYDQAKEGLDTLEAEFTATISKLIVDNSDKISTQKANLNIQTINFERQTLVSPVDGIVKTLDVKTVGGVIAPTQVAATVIGDDTQLIADVDILNKDIGYIRTGQTAAIKLDTFNFQKYGKLEGTVISVSPDAILDERKGWIYKAKVSLDDSVFKKSNPDAILNSGMECTAEIKISKRRIIDFFLEPVLDHFDGSLGVR